VTRFSSRNISVAVVPAGTDAVWAVLIDPNSVAELTPLVARIEAQGDQWWWTLVGVSALGVSLAPTFTERMTFEPRSRIVFTHDPAAGQPERAGADGVYELVAVDKSATRVSIDITAWVELPLPPLARGAVERVMAMTMQRAGDRFARGLYRRLGLDTSGLET
jgi:carbon monoxide dehydrogenase subunit G